MTIERLAHFTAETRVLTGMANYAFGPTISTTQAKTGTYSYHIGYNVGPFGKAFKAAQTAIRMGYWQYLVDAGTTGSTVIYQAGYGLGFDTGDNRIYVSLNSGTGLLTLGRGQGSFSDELLTTATIPPQYATISTWFHVGIVHVVNSVGGFLSVYIDGNRVLNYVGDTRPSHNAAGQIFKNDLIYALGPGGTSTGGVNGFHDSYIDDMYIDSYAGEDDAPVPSRRFLFILPTGAGANAEWTPVGSGNNYQNVDDNPNNGDTDYNKALSADLTDTFLMGDITLPVDHRIVAAIPMAYVKRLDSETPNQLSVHAFDGTLYENSADLDLSMSYDIPVFARFTNAPDGSLWDEAKFNAMQFGYKSRGLF